MKKKRNTDDMILFVATRELKCYHFYRSGILTFQLVCFLNLIHDVFDDETGYKVFKKSSERFYGSGL